MQSINENSRINIGFPTKNKLQDKNRLNNNTNSYFLPRYKIIDLLADFSISWTFWLYPDLSIAYMSPSAKYFSGYSVEEFIENPDLINKIIHSNDLEKFTKRIDELNNGKIIAKTEFRIITKHGDVKWISYTCQVVYDNSNRYIGRYISCTDITEFKKITRDKEYNDFKLLSIYDHAELGHYQIYPNGYLKMANKTLLNMLGYTSFEEASSVNFEKNCFGNLDTRYYIKNNARIYGTVKDFETEWVRKNKTMLIVRETLTAVKENDGSVLYYEGIIKDITEKRTAEISLLEASEHKKQLENLKNEFLATVSHEIRSPLNSIINISQMLRTEFSTELSEDLSEYISIIEKEGKRIQRTTSLLMEMSQLVTQTFDFTAVEINLLNDVLFKVFQEYKEHAHVKKIDFTLENRIANSLIIADKHSVYQIINQLVDNAIKYTNKGSVSIKMYRNKQNNITVEISDTGIGIAEEYIPHLFSLFSQENNSYARMFEGTGLGLALVKNYCELNNALIEVESSKGIGSNFKIIFTDTHYSLI